MGDSHNKEFSGVVCVVSRQAGAVAGTSVVISKKIADCGAKTIAAAKDCLKQPLKCLVPARDKKSGATSKTSAVKSIGEQETGRKKAAKALIAAMESDLAAAQRELKKARSNAEKTQSKLASQLDELKVEKKSLISDLEQAKSKASGVADREDEVKTQIAALESDLTAAQRQLGISHKKDEEDAKPQPPSDISSVQTEGETVLTDQGAEEEVEVVPIEEEVQPEIEPIAAQSVDQLNVKAEEQLSQKTVVAEMPSPAAQSVEQLNVKVEEQSSQKAVVAEMPSPAMVTDEEVQAAVFANATDKIIFARAFSDIASLDTTMRVDAAKTMAGIRHKLSIKALAAQMPCESSAQVRQECIKALATLEMTEALPAIEHALIDEAGSVRLAAVWGLYHLAGVESAPALIRMLADNDEEVRRRAATCIGWLGKEELAAELLPLLDDNSISVRRATIEAMSNLRSRQVVSSLIERLNDPVESIRKVILSAIETITGKKMSESFPKDQKEFECLVARWQQWRKEQLLG